MLDRLPLYLSTVPSFLAYFAVALALLALFLAIYTRVTPHDEFALIRAGNAAAATGLAGSVLGFVLPLASAIAHSQSVLDMVVWGAVAMIVQIATYSALRLWHPRLVDDIAEGKTAAAITLGGFSFAVGVLNAACMTS